jgi:hypothetical protein
VSLFLRVFEGSSCHCVIARNLSQMLRSSCLRVVVALRVLRENLASSCLARKSRVLVSSCFPRTSGVLVSSRGPRGFSCFRVLVFRGTFVCSSFRAFRYTSRVFVSSCRRVAQGFRHLARGPCLRLRVFQRFSSRSCAGNLFVYSHTYFLTMPQQLASLASGAQDNAAFWMSYVHAFRTLC